MKDLDWMVYSTNPTKRFKVESDNIYFDTEENFPIDLNHFFEYCVRIQEAPVNIFGTFEALPLGMMFDYTVDVKRGINNDVAFTFIDSYNNVTSAHFTIQDLTKILTIIKEQNKIE